MARSTLEEMIEYTREQVERVVNVHGKLLGGGRGRAVLPAYDLLPLLEELKQRREATPSGRQDAN